MSDVMLIGVLRMPMPNEPSDMMLRQFVSRAREAADRIESNAQEIDRLQAEVEALRAALLGLREVYSRVNPLAADKRSAWEDADNALGIDAARAEKGPADA